MAFRIAEPTDCPIVTSVRPGFRPQTTSLRAIASNIGMAWMPSALYPTHWMSAIAAEGLFGSHAKTRSACAICTRRGPSQWLTVRR